MSELLIVNSEDIVNLTPSEETKVLVINSDYPLSDDLLEFFSSTEKLRYYSYLRLKNPNISPVSIVNLSNNLDSHLIIDSIEEDDILEICKDYILKNVSKYIYPASIVIMSSFGLLFYRVIRGYDIFNDFYDLVEPVIQKFMRDFLVDSYDLDLLKNCIKRFIIYLIENMPNFCIEIGKYMDYIFHSELNEIKINNVEDFVLTQKVATGTIIPLMYVMRQLSYDPFRDGYLTRDENFKFFIHYSSTTSICQPIIDYYHKVNEYISKENKEEIIIEDLSSITNVQVLECLDKKQIIKTKKPETNIDLFPLLVNVYE